MSYNVNDVINVALNEVGYLEKASNSQLYDKTANAGSGNYTKYACDLDNVANFYNGHKNGYDWCDVFVDWCFVKAFGVEGAKQMLCQPSDSAGAGCPYSMGYYKSNGQFYSSPKIGDQIFFFDSDGVIGHTGIVYAVDSENVYTVEGNTSGASGVIANGGGVCKKSYSLNSGRIAGYGRPNYTVTAANSANAGSQSTGNLSVGSTGSAVLELQTKLNKKKEGMGLTFSTLDVDGIFGSATEKAVMEFQKASGLTVDGIVGINTLSALNKTENTSSKSILKSGSRGDEVKTLQSLLNEKKSRLGLSYDVLSVDGIFGSATENAVKEFQKASGIAVDGIVGSNTWGKLLNRTSLPTSLLKSGSRGDDVEMLQTLLNSTKTKMGLSFDVLSVDGIFGSATENAVKEFQNASGITVDGIVGSNTWGKLTEVFG